MPAKVAVFYLQVKFNPSAINNSQDLTWPCHNLTSWSPLCQSFKAVSFTCNYRFGSTILCWCERCKQGSHVFTWNCVWSLLLQITSLIITCLWTPPRKGLLPSACRTCPGRGYGWGLLCVPPHSRQQRSKLGRSLPQELLSKYMGTEIVFLRIHGI